jgi:N-acylneuraminate cytidylyltransferase
MTVAIIPARGGSKRIPGKNIRPFLGKPIIAYSIEAARKSGLFRRVIVSTDSAEIAEVARRYGAEVPFVRPARLANDYAGTMDVVKHALMSLSEAGATFEFACCVYATAPFVSEEALRRGLEMLRSSTRSFAFAVTSFPFPIQRGLRLDANGAVHALHPEFIGTRSQDLEPAFHDAGQFYWGRVDAFLNDEVIFSPASLAVVLPRHEVQDIDTLEDWERAELMFKSLRR